MATMFDNLPAALVTLFLAACVLWLIWQAFHRLLSPRKRRLEPSLTDQSGNGHIEPAAPQAASTIPDAADVLALKAAIDNLAQQVAALERRLAAGQTSLLPPPVPTDKVIEQSAVLPSISPDHRI